MMGKKLIANHVFDGGEDLGEGDFAGIVAQFAFTADAVVQVSPAGVLQHQVEAARRLHHLVQTDDVGMLQGLHAVDLPGEQALGLSVQPHPVQDLQGYLVCQRGEREESCSSRDLLGEAAQKAQMQMFPCKGPSMLYGY